MKEFNHNGKYDNSREIANAFPASAFNFENDGMTLRDYFAAKAMQIMWDAYDKGYCGTDELDKQNIEIIAEGAYRLADAMLAARGEK